MQSVLDMMLYHKNVMPTVFVEARDFWSAHEGLHRQTINNTRGSSVQSRVSLSRRYIGVSDGRRLSVHLCSAWNVYRLLILGRVSCSDLDISSVCAIGSPCASDDPFAFAHFSL